MVVWLKPCKSRSSLSIIPKAPTHAVGALLFARLKCTASAKAQARCQAIAPPRERKRGGNEPGPSVCRWCARRFTAVATAVFVGRVEAPLAGRCVLAGADTAAELHDLLDASTVEPETRHGAGDGAEAVR